MSLHILQLPTSAADVKLLVPSQKVTASFPPRDTISIKRRRKMAGQNYKSHVLTNALAELGMGDHLPSPISILTHH